MGCDICELKNKENIVYENDKIIIVLADSPSTSGHIQIFPKRHITIMEQLSPEESSYIINAANKTSMILFEALKIHGTNIIVQNGIPAGQIIPHFSIHVIPRRTDDGLSLDWDMKQASNESLESMQQLISEGIIYDSEKKPSEEQLQENEHINTIKEESIDINSNIKEEYKTDKTIESDTRHISDIKSNSDSKKTNYWLKSLERIP
ncbi:TPA: HIT family protein [bacterium]|nr:HIT family protein [bacterium]